MKRRNSGRERLSRVKISVLICLTLLLLGCGSYRWGIFGKDRLVYDAEKQKLAEGHAAFRKGDLARSKQIFDTLSQEAEHDEITHQALYALACTSLLLAKSRDEFNEAMILWHAWSELEPTAVSHEDPRMLQSLLEKKFPYTVPENQKPDTVPEQEPNTDLAIENIISWRLLRGKEKDIQRLKYQLEAKNKLIRKLKKDKAKVAALEKEIQILQHHKDYLEAKDKEIQRLRHQIKSMEAIDQKMQKKKKDIATP